MASSVCQKILCNIIGAADSMALLELVVILVLVSLPSSPGQMNTAVILVLPGTCIIYSWCIKKKDRYDYL